MDLSKWNDSFIINTSKNKQYYSEGRVYTIYITKNVHTVEVRDKEGNLIHTFIDTRLSSYNHLFNLTKLSFCNI